jgi:hypothetical protein
VEKRNKHINLINENNAPNKIKNQNTKAKSKSKESFRYPRHEVEDEWEKVDEILLFEAVW